MKRLTLGVLLAIFAAALFVSEAQAMPAFARKYRMSCTTCHYPFPRLKAYGDDFAANGFQLPDQDAPRYFVDTGDPHLTLIRDFPIAIRFDSWMYNDGENEKGMDFRTPFGVKLLSGGALSEHYAYYFYFFMNEAGSVVGLEDAFIMYNNAFGRDLDFYAGQFQVSDPLFKRELRLTFADYDLYKTRVGLSGIDLTYGRGLMATWGLPTGTDLVVSVTNGNGIGAANADESFDNDARKGIFGRVSQDLGEMLRLGGMTYIGGEENAVKVSNDVTYFGADATLEAGPFQVNGQWLHRTDSNPAFMVNNPVDAVTDGIMAEVVYWPNMDASRWYAVALYNRVDSDDNAVDTENATLHWGYLLRTNMRLGVEGTYDLEAEKFRGGLGLVVAF